MAKRQSREKGADTQRQMGVIATPQKDWYAYISSLTELRPNEDLLLKTQTPQNSQFVYPWGLYEERLAVDSHLKAVVDVRKMGVLALPTLIEPADESPRAKLIADWVTWMLAEISRDYYDGGFARDRFNALDAIPFGFAVLEIDWDLKDGWLVPMRLLHRPMRQFKFTWGGDLRLLVSGADLKGTPLPDKKFLVFTPYGRFENPYGIPAVQSAYFPSKFKTAGMKFWAIFLDKFGSPTIEGKYPAGAKKEEQDKLYEIIAAYQQETGILVPEDFAISLIEARRSGTANYEGFIEVCNREISKAILGQNLTTEVKGGSYAAANIHQMVRRDIQQADAWAEMSLWNDQLIRWAVDFNFAEPRLYPKWRIRVEAAADMRLTLDIVREMLATPLPMSRAEIYEMLHLSPPKDGDDSIVGGSPTARTGGLPGNPNQDGIEQVDYFPKSELVKNPAGEQ